jgi:hypothetical protein
MIKQAPAREFQKRFLDAAHAGALATDKDHRWDRVFRHKRPDTKSHRVGVIA